MVNFSEIPAIEDWLTQFDVPDKYVAEYMLRRLRYVSFAEVEEWLHQSVRELLREIELRDGRAAVAIFPVAKPFIHNFNKNKEPKLPNDSAGRIAHSLKNIERDLPNYVELTPRVESMRNKKVKHIIFVDDFIGTGDRFTNSWKAMVSPSIKSWCSRGWCKVWLISFAAHQSGLNRLTHKIRSVNLAQVRANLIIDDSFLIQNRNVRHVLYKYGMRLGSAKQVMGYGGLASPVVFQYGCPNNVPLIFWVRPPRSARNGWRPLFPNRSVTNGVYALFAQDLTRDALSEELWMAGHYALALAALEQISKHGGNHKMLLILGLLAKGRKLDTIRNIMVATQVEFDSILSNLTTGGLIDKQGVITRFGHDVLARSVRSSKKML